MRQPDYDEDVMDTSLALAIMMSNAKKFFPKQYEKDPFVALGYIFNDIIKQATGLSKEDRKEIGDNCVKLMEQAKAETPELMKKLDSDFLDKHNIKGFDC